MIYRMLLYLTMVLNSARTHFGNLPLITILLMYYALLGTQGLKGKLRGLSAPSNHYSARIKIPIQLSLLTVLRLCRMGFHPVSCSWVTVCGPKFLQYPPSSNQTYMIPIGKEFNRKRINTDQSNRLIMKNDTGPMISLL